MSTAFHSDELLGYADARVRDSGLLDPSKIDADGYLRVDAGDVGDLGEDLGRGYERIRKAASAQAPNHGPLNPRVDNLRSVTATYFYDKNTSQWFTITIFPDKL